VKKRQVRKFDALIKEKEDLENKNRQLLEDHKRMKKEKIKNEVIDLTKDGIDNDIKSYLSLGPGFCEAPTRVPYERIIAETEKMCTKIKREGEINEIDEEIVEHEIGEIRENVKVILEKARHKKYKTNLTKEELNGKKKAVQDKRKVFLPTDKGRIMVAMDRFESEGGEQSYEYKMKQVLVDLKAKPSIRAKKDWDLTDKVCRDGTRVIETIVERGEISKEDAERLKPKDVTPLGYQDCQKSTKMVFH
jgi:hypothetical protein